MNKEVIIMLLNELVLKDLSGEICYKLKNDNIVKLGNFAIGKEYHHVIIDLCNICRIEYEYRTPEQLKDCVGITQHMYWFKSQYVCDRYHGSNCRDDDWIIDLFREVSPFTDDINYCINVFFRKAFNKVQQMSGEQTA